MQRARKMTKYLDSPGGKYPARAISVSACSAAIVAVAGCARAPSFDILGSFFPAWILCGILGILLAVVVRLYFVHIKLEGRLKPLIVVYPCLAAFFTFTLWLLFFS
jgi:hypothetical protein